MAIEFCNVSMRYPHTDRYAVADVNLQIAQGSFVSILGGSGSGKTTLLKLVNRIYEPTTGKILYFGEPVNQMKVEEYRRKMGYVIQQAGLFPHMTVEENVGIIPAILKWNKGKIASRVEELLELVCLCPKEFKKRYPAQLSGGQQQRVGLARAMAADPDILLMDEPFGAIDAVTRKNLQEELLLIHKKFNKTILFVTHDIAEAFKLGNKVMVMHEGRIQQFSSPCELIMRPENAYVARLLGTQDCIQRLKALKAKVVMTPAVSLPQEDAFRVGQEESLHNILTYFLEHNDNQILVEDEKRSVVGEITWEQFKNSTRQEKIVSA